MQPAVEHFARADLLLDAVAIVDGRLLGDVDDVAEAARALVGSDDGSAISPRP
jgi:hypothetical protein